MKLIDKNKDNIKNFKWSPRNLFDFLDGNPEAPSFFRLLVKHHDKIEDIINSKSDDVDILNAIFILNLNKFSSDLLNISKLISEINSEIYKVNVELDELSNMNIDAVDLACKMESFYLKAITYDEYFSVSWMMPRVNKKPCLPLLFIKNPFQYNDDSTNIENYLNLVSLFHIYNDIFVNYLNCIYGDGVGGEDFSGANFGSISSEYSVIKDAVFLISDKIKPDEKNRLDVILKSKNQSIQEILKNYPSTVYVSVKSLLNHIENR